MNKQCRMCSRTKPVEAFNKENNSKDGLRARCRECQRVKRREIYWRNPEAARDYAREWKAANSERIPHYLRRARHGIEPEQWYAMRAAQGDACAICRRPLPLRVDHCHVSGVIRGLLCDKCNRGLGFFDDVPDRLIAAAAYLIASKESACTA